MEEQGRAGGLRGEDLDRAMQAAWGRGASRRESVLDAVEARIGSAPRVLLREFAEKEAAAVEASGSEPLAYAGRYQVLGELGSGGVGLVLKGHDVDLGRDVAVKVLRGDLADDANVVRRFVEEAQIGGQLQHPGIVPVYELGLQADERPFFTMKLIKGVTLAALLDERRDVGESHHRLLSIFVQICHTVAYAHARGVIHRDLKPSNVMVGDFGEVQVVDWGLAKILGRRDDPASARPEDAHRTVIRTVRAGSAEAASQHGTVMGTPAYMPPEQACGQVERLDPRTDVFALGAILCEILTGDPPYAGAVRDVLLQAIRAELDGVFARLDGCGADPALVALTRRCLSPAQDDRPADAQILARELTDHLHSVEERARAADMEAARAEVRAAGERKARKLTVALAAVVLAAVLLGGGGLYWAEAGAQDRRQRAVALVRGAMEEARQLQGEATRDRDLWPRAADAATRAVDLARQQDADAAIRRAAVELADEISSQARRAERNAALLRTLSEIRAQRGDRLDLQAADSAYAAAFAPFGLDDAAQAAEAIRATGIGEELAAFVDDWMWLRGLVGLPNDDLLAVARAADPDPWRDALRSAASTGDRQGLVAAADEVSEEELARGNLPNLLALHLASVGERGRAIDVLRAAQRVRPDDFWLSYQLGYELTLLTEPAWGEAIGFFRVAIAGNPESIEARHELGIALFKTGLYGQAIQVFEDALAAHPDDLHGYDHLTESHERNGTLVDLVARWERDPASWRDHYRLGRALELQADWTRVIREYELAVAANPTPYLLTRLGFAHQFAGDLDAAIAAHRRALELDPACSEAYAGITRVHGQRSEYEAALASNTRVVELAPYDPFSYLVHGWVLSHLGRNGEAAAAYERALHVGGHSGLVRVHVAYDSVRREELDEAAAILEEAVRLPARFAEGRYWMDFWERRSRRGRVTRVPSLGVQSSRGQAYHLLGTVRLLQGRLPEAVAAWRRDAEAAQGTADEPPLRVNLAMALVNDGAYQEAEEHARWALDRAPGPGLEQRALQELFWALMGQGRVDEAAPVLARLGELLLPPDTPAALLEENDRLSESLLRLGAHLPAILDGSYSFGSVEDELVAAWICREVACFQTASRIYERVFQEHPEWMGTPGPWPDLQHWGWEAARTAALASTGCGTAGVGLPAREAEHWRTRALEWLRADYAEWLSQVEAGSAEHVEQFPDQLAQWLLRWDLSPVRAASNLAALPEDERVAWTALWTELRERLEELEPE